MRFYDPDEVVRWEPSGVFFRTEEEYEHYKGYLSIEEQQMWPQMNEDEDEEDDR